MTGRRLPPPPTVSAQAQAALAAPSLPQAELPAPDDVIGWRRHVAEQDAMMMAFLTERMPQDGVTVTSATLDGVPVFIATPDGCDPASRRVYLDIHGGALVYLGGDAARLMAGATALRTGVRVVAVDYRMPPDHPYPAGLDDCVAVYQALLDSHAPEAIIVGGSSAGGNLAAALMLRLVDAALPLPAAAVLLTPEVDLTESGDSFATMLGLDTMLTGSLAPLNALYAGGAALDHPHVSPLFGDFTRGFPPTFLQTGTRDLFLSNTVLMHRALRRAGIAAELHVFEAMPHGGFGGAPEDAELTDELRCFLAARWAGVV